MSSVCSAPVAPLTEAVIMATKWSCIYGNGFSWLPQMENFYLCMWMATTLPNAFTRYCPLATIVIVYLDTTLWFISIQRICINVSGKGLILELWIRQNESVIAIFHELIFFLLYGSYGSFPLSEVNYSLQSTIHMKLGPACRVSVSINVCQWPSFKK